MTNRSWANRANVSLVCLTACVLWIGCEDDGDDDASDAGGAGAAGAVATSGSHANAGHAGQAMSGGSDASSMDIDGGLADSSVSMPDAAGELDAAAELDASDAPDTGTRVCDGQYDEGDESEVCSCQALGLGFCIQYHSDGGNLMPGECATLGGAEVMALCPQDDVIGDCHEIDDCHDPRYVFYANYSGDFRAYDDIDAVENACNGGQIVGSTCAEWSVP